MSRYSRTGWKYQENNTPLPVRWVTPDAKEYVKEVDDGLLRVFVGHDLSGRWHLSIAHSVVDANGHRKPGRYPTWDEIREARDQFTPPKATMAMLLPPKEEYVNVHNTTFHLYELAD